MSENRLNLILKRISVAVREIIGEPLCEVVLYGSYARGDYDAESDIDIALIVDADRLATKCYQSELINLISDLSLNDDVLVSINTIPREEFETYKASLPYYRNINKEGVRLSA